MFGGRSVSLETARTEAEALAWANAIRERREAKKGDKDGEQRSLAAAAAWLSINLDPWEASVAASGNTDDELELDEQVERLLGLIRWARKERRLAHS